MKYNQIQFILQWILIPVINFCFWYYHASIQYAESNHVSDTNILSNIIRSSKCEKSYANLLQKQEIQEETACEIKQTKECLPKLDKKSGGISLEFVETIEFDRYRAERLGSLKYPQDIIPDDTDTAILTIGQNRLCQVIKHIHIGITRDGMCFAMAYSNLESNHSMNVNRYESDIDIYGLSVSKPDSSQMDEYLSRYALNAYNEGKVMPTGYFRKVPKEQGRSRLKEKIVPFLKHFDEIQVQLGLKLSENGIQPGDNVVTMVLNEGEIDLFLNFACSCRLHDISLSNVLVFASNREVIPIIESCGPMAIYHSAYASVSRRASMDYLDRVFVDMMWYKAFSVYILIRKRYNVLFQDVDLVWFKNPMSYFHDQLEKHKVRIAMTGMKIEAFFSDDGQRSHRYAPYYANSGFDYYLASELTEYFTWSILTAFDSIQVLGSHQNVFTTKLIEGLALDFSNIKILPLKDFPNGILYHHDEGYMRRLREDKVHPYGYHMCWTSGKADKLEYLRKTSMWYLTDTCSPVDALTDGGIKDGEETSRGVVFEFIKDNIDLPPEEQWDRLGNKCCTKMLNAP